MELKNQIYLVRHGESRNNILGIESCKIETQKQYGLTDLGRAQIASNAGKYSFDYIYTSPFRRTKESAAIFAKRSGIEFFENELLKEFDLGVYDGKPYTLAEIYIQHEVNNIKEVPVQNGESWDQMYDRCYRFLQLLEATYTGKTILVVTHGSPVEAFIQMAKGVNTGFGPLASLPKNGEIINFNQLVSD